MLADPTGELVGIADIGEGDHFVALIVMSEDHQPAAQRGPGSGDTTVHLLVRQPEISLRERLALGDVFLLVFSEQRNQHKV
jgi:hypothetical protein